MSPIPPGVLELLSAHAEVADRRTDWPTASWDALKDAGLLGRAIPREYGGEEFSPVELLRGYEGLGAACATTAFILSQREAAVRRVLAGPPRLRERYLPPLARGMSFLTVGLSQLTTSRLHQGPALRATPSPTGFLLEGDVPWVTGADRAETIVVGATLADGKQLLLALPTDTAGVRVGEPMPLASLLGSRTTSVRCDGVEVARENVLAGPTEHVLGKSGGGGLETSCLALALSRAATHFIETEAARRPELRDVADRFRGANDDLRGRMHRLATDPDSDAILALRVDCTRLVLRATQAALLVAKGNGFVAPHPASRWARQSLFFLVWSCPRTVSDAVLSTLLP